MKHLTNQRSLLGALACAVVLLSATPSLAVSGHAVSACWRWCVNNYSPCVPEMYGVNNYYWRGKIIRVDITNNVPTRCDTIFPGLAQYPTLSFDGTKVAFFRLGCRIQGTSLTGDCDSVYISVVNSDGTNLRNLVGMKGSTIVSFADQEASMDWPVGEWIYYYKLPMSSGEIWRVNVNTPSQNELVVKYIGNPSPDFFYMRRWSLSADGQYAGGQFKSTSCGENSMHTFPPANGNPCLGKPTGHTPSGCNGAISAGGNVFASYGGGCHDYLDITTWNHATNVATYQGMKPNAAIAEKYGKPMATCSEMIRWSVNSEKWLLQGTGWYGHASGMAYGGNQLLVNWVDVEGFPVTNNVKLPKSSAGWEVPGQTYYQNDPGDFWVSGGPANCYEDKNGTWVQVPGVTAASRTVRSIGGIGELSIVRDGAAAVLHLPGSGVRSIQVVDARGRSVLQRTTSDATVTMPASSIRSGTYFLRVVGDGLDATKTITLSR